MLPKAKNILVVSLRRSGGKLVRKLLDGHPSISALPLEHWHTNKKGRHPGPLLDVFGSLDGHAKLALMGFERVTARKIELLHGAEARDAFMAQAARDAELSSNSADLYERFVNRYLQTFCGINCDKRVVNHCGNLALMSPAELDQVFGPSTKVIIWRDPRAVYVSSKMARLLKKQSVTEMYVEKFCDEYETAHSYYSGWAGPLTLQFERLVLETESCMRELASALQMKFNDVLLVPTVLGMPSDANTSFQRSFGAVDATAASDWSARIEARDRRIIERRLGHIIESYRKPLAKAA